ncbi:MAG TPA: hypothetical protein VFQ53_32260 [Kofleriaceae bacterium]|nr:hypothetical protein [Kofleriaceae bacterium]
MKRTIIVAALAISATASADTITVGVFAPSAPLPSTAARVELANKLGDHLGKALGGTGMGRVYARAGDFAAAVKKGELAVALVDPVYLAGSSGYTVLASTGSQPWQIVARGNLKFGDLRGKRVLVPANGGHETDFVLNVMLGGDTGRDYFGKIEPALDTSSALAALSLGKTDAVVVPAGVDLPSGTTAVLALPAIPGPTLVAYNASAAQRTALVQAAGSFRGDGIAGFKPIDGDAVRAIARRFSAPVKRGPMGVPNARLVVGDLVEGRTFTIERTAPATFAAQVSTRPGAEAGSAR